VYVLLSLPRCFCAIHNVWEVLSSWRERACRPFLNHAVVLEWCFSMVVRWQDTTGHLCVCITLTSSVFLRHTQCMGSFKFLEEESVSSICKSCRCVGMVCFHGDKVAKHDWVFMCMYYSHFLFVSVPYKMYADSPHTHIHTHTHTHTQCHLPGPEGDCVCVTVCVCGSVYL